MRFKSAAGRTGFTYAALLSVAADAPAVGFVSEDTPVPLGALPVEDVAFAAVLLLAVVAEGVLLLVVAVVAADGGRLLVGGSAPLTLSVNM